MIKNFDDVAEYFGSKPSEADISHAVYKNTNCGAWLEFVTTAPKTVKTRFHVLLNPTHDSKDTVKIHSFKIAGRWNDNKGWLAFSEIGNAPEELRIFLGMTPDMDQSNSTIQGITWAEILENSKGKDCPFVLHRNTTVISTDIDVNTTVEKFGIKIGTIVEGADAEPDTITLYFPFSEEDLHNAIQELEYEANEIWHEWNS